MAVTQTIFIHNTYPLKVDITFSMSQKRHILTLF